MHEQKIIKKKNNDRVPASGLAHVYMSKMCFGEVNLVKGDTIIHHTIKGYCV